MLFIRFLLWFSHHFISHMAFCFLSCCVCKDTTLSWLKINGYSPCQNNGKKRIDFFQLSLHRSPGQCLWLLTNPTTIRYSMTNVVCESNEGRSLPPFTMGCDNDLIVMRPQWSNSNAPKWNFAGRCLNINLV